MRLPERAFQPSAPTLAQLRERLANLRGTPMGNRYVREGETLCDRLELMICERECQAGLRQRPTGVSAWGRLA